MRQRVWAIAAVAMAPALAWGQALPPQDPAITGIAQEWAATTLQEQHLQDKLADLIRAYQKAGAAERDSDSRLKWVLDNWVAKKPVAAK